MKLHLPLSLCYESHLFHVYTHFQPSEVSLKCVHDIKFVDILEWILKGTLHIICRDFLQIWRHTVFHYIYIMVEEIHELIIAYQGLLTNAYLCSHIVHQCSVWECNFICFYALYNFERM